MQPDGVSLAVRERTRLDLERAVNEDVRRLLGAIEAFRRRPAAAPRSRPRAA